MRSARLAAVPLWVMAAAFVLPAYRACEAPFSPAEYATHSAFSFAWVTPPFLFAAVFAVLTAVALQRRAATQQVRRLGLLAVGAMAALTLTVSSIWAIAETHEWPWFLASAAGVAGAALLIRRGRGREPWHIWQHLVAAFAVLAATSGPSVFLAVEGVARPSNVYWGGWLYLGALVSLLVLSAVNLARPPSAHR